MPSFLEPIYNYFYPIEPKRKIVIVSGFFDPCGPQHLLLFNEAKKLGNYLIVGVNSDLCALKKKGQHAFIPLKDRIEICENFKMVDKVVSFNDNDGTACQLLQDIYDEYKQDIDNGYIELIFANGGDRSAGSTPEQKYVDENLNGKVKMIYEVGGSYKRASSSDYLRNWVNNTMERYNIDFKLEKKY